MQPNKTLRLLLLAGVLPLSAISHADVRTDGSGCGAKFKWQDADPANFGTGEGKLIS